MYMDHDRSNSWLFLGKIRNKYSKHRRSRNRCAERSRSRMGLNSTSDAKTLAEEKIFTKPITVTNKIGGSGDVGWKYTKQKGGHVLAINSSLLITNNLLGHSKLTYKDFTPLALLASDWEVVVVSKDSNIENANELMEQLKQNKKNFNIGVAPGLGNDDHLSFVQVSKAFGINPAELQFFVYENKEKS